MVGGKISGKIGRLANNVTHKFVAHPPATASWQIRGQFGIIFNRVNIDDRDGGFEELAL